MNKPDRSHFKTEQDYSNPIIDYIAIALVFLVALMAEGIVDAISYLLSPLLF